MILTFAYVDPTETTCLPLHSAVSTHIPGCLDILASDSTGRTDVYCHAQLKSCDFCGEIS